MREDAVVDSIRLGLCFGKEVSGLSSCHNARCLNNLPAKVTEVILSLASCPRCAHSAIRLHRLPTYLS